jgi:hypothetical protein
MKYFTKLSKKQKIEVEVLGWVGMFFVLAAYGLITFGYVTNQSLVWQILNLFGSSGIIINSLTKRAMPEVWLNIIFAVVALIGIVQILRG